MPTTRERILNTGLHADVERKFLIQIRDSGLMNLRSINPSDLEFLTTLDKRLRKWRNADPCGAYAGSIDHEFLKGSASEEEVRRVMEACERNNLVFYPQTTEMGFQVGYFVSKTLSLPADRRSGLMEAIRRNTCPDINLGAFTKFLTWNEFLLGMVERQMPESYQGDEGFKRLSEYFMSARNIELAKDAGIEIIKEYSRNKY